MLFDCTLAMEDRLLGFVLNIECGPGPVSMNKTLHALNQPNKDANP